MFEEVEEQKKQKELPKERSFHCKLHKVVEIGHKRFTLTFDAANYTHKHEIISKLIELGADVGLKHQNNLVLFISMTTSDFDKIKDGHKNKQKKG